MVKYRMYKSSKEDGDETAFDVVSQELLSNLRIGDSVGIESEDDSSEINYYKVISRTFYEDEFAPICDVVLEEE